MNSKMNGVSYDTENAEEIASYQPASETNSSDHDEETLYVTESGEFFIHRDEEAVTERGESNTDGQSDNGKILALDESEAKDALALLERREADINQDAFLRSIRRTATTVDIEEFLDRLTKEARPTQVTLAKAEFFANSLCFIIHASPSQSEAVSEILEDIDRVEIDGEGYWFTFEVTSYGPQQRGRLTAYAGDNILNMDPVPVTEGVERLEDWIDENLNDSATSAESLLN